MSDDFSAKTRQLLERADELLDKIQRNVPSLREQLDFLKTSGTLDAVKKFEQTLREESKKFEQTLREVRKVDKQLRLKIVKATYGVPIARQSIETTKFNSSDQTFAIGQVCEFHPHLSRDVTTQLQIRVRHNTLSLIVNNRTMGGDPARGKRKTLVVKYYRREEEEILYREVKEDQLLTIV